MLSVDECGDPAIALGIRHGMQGDGGLAGGFRSVDLHDAAARESADTERGIQRHRAGGDHLDRRAGVIPETHDRPLAELAVNLRERGVELGAAFRGGLPGGLRSSHVRCSFRVPGGPGELIVRPH